jgi:predicted CoA-binding protein
MALFPNPDDEAIRRLLEKVRRIAVVGLSPKPHRDSHRVARYLLESGYEIVPVYPREEQILGQRVYRRVQDIAGAVDLVDVFRRSEELPEVIDDALAARAGALWLQLGCIDESGARQAQDAGLTVVMDRCLMVEHARLLH